MRIIDADALLRDIARYHLSDGKFQHWVEVQPTIDAVEVVRCKDCKWGREACGNIECHVDLNIPSEYHGYYWYCPNGERKE